MSRVRSISVAIASYNGATYLYDQLLSIKNQTVPVDHIVISDDNSTDDTVKISQAFRSEFDGLLTILENRTTCGCKANFDAAISACNGNYIFIADQDDIWARDKVETVVEAFESTQLKFIIHDVTVFSGSRILAESKIQNFLNANISLDNYVQGSASAIHSDFKKLVLPIPKYALAHDNWINDLACLTNEKFIITRSLMYYRRHSLNISNSALNNFSVFKYLVCYVSNLITYNSPSSYRNYVYHLSSLSIRLSMFKSRYPTAYSDCRHRYRISRIRYFVKSLSLFKGLIYVKRISRFYKNKPLSLIKDLLAF